VAKTFSHYQKQRTYCRMYPQVQEKLMEDIVCIRLLLVENATGPEPDLFNGMMFWGDGLSKMAKARVNLLVELTLTLF